MQYGLPSLNEKLLKDAVCIQKGKRRKRQNRSQRKVQKVNIGIKKGQSVEEQWVSWWWGCFSYLHSYCIMHEIY